MYFEYCNEEMLVVKCFILGSVLLYFILFIDIISDYVFLIGYLDDVIVV